MAMNWEWDATSGVFKNHALSEKMRENAMYKMVFGEHVTPEPGYGAGRGESVTIPRMSAVTEPTDPTLDENRRIPEDKYSISTTSVTVAEIGRSIQVTNKFLSLSKYDMNDHTQRWLQRQLQLSLDTKIATAFKQCKVKYIPTAAAAGTFDTDGTASTTALVNWNIWHQNKVFDYMFNTLRVPMIEDSYYMALFNWTAMRGILDDPTFETYARYGGLRNIHPGLDFQIGPVRYRSTNHANALSAGTGTSDVLGEGVIFGQDAMAAAIALDPEIRVSRGESDHGRFKSAAWYGIVGYGEPYPTANAGEARIVHVTSDV